MSFWYERELKWLCVIRNPNVLPLTGDWTPDYEQPVSSVEEKTRENRMKIFFTQSERSGLISSLLTFHLSTEQPPPLLGSIEKVASLGWRVAIGTDDSCRSCCNGVVMQHGPQLRSRFPAVLFCCCCCSGVSVFFIFGRAYISRFVFASHTGCSHTTTLWERMREWLEPGSVPLSLLLSNEDVAYFF